MYIEPTINRFRVFINSIALRALIPLPNDLKDVTSIELPERALVAAGMSLHWKKDREDKPVYMEDDKSKIWNFLTFLFLVCKYHEFVTVSPPVVVSLYVVAYKRDNGNMTTVLKRADEELWYLRIVKKFALPRDEDWVAQPPTDAEKQSAPAVSIAPKKIDAPKAHYSKAKNIREEKKGARRLFDSGCDYSGV
ncbi:hypothetical protein Hanom_Chr16g01448041 [Helianthus anomalus]